MKTDKTSRQCVFPRVAAAVVIATLALAGMGGATLAVITSESATGNPWGAVPDCTQWQFQPFISSTDLVNNGQGSLAGVSFTGSYGGGGGNVGFLNNGQLTDNDASYIGQSSANFGGYVSVNDNSPLVVTYTLDTIAAPLGYDLTRIETFASWFDNRSSQEYTVSVAYVSDPSVFVQLGSTFSIANAGGTGQATRLVLGDDTDEVFASGVAAVRFSLDTVDNWNGYREIDVHGYATGGEPPAPPAEITGFTFGPHGPAHVGPLDNGVADISIQLPYGTDVTNITPFIVVSPGASCDPASGVPADFSVPVEYVVTNGDVSNTYTVRVVYDAPEAYILSFNFGAYGPATIGPVSGDSAFITIQLPYGTDLSALAPTYTLSSGAVCDPASGSVRNFNGEVVYTVTSAATPEHPEPTVIHYIVTTTTTLLVVLEDLKHSDASNFWTPSPDNAQEFYSGRVSSTDLINQGQITLASQTGGGGGGNALASLNDGSNGTQVTGTEHLFNGYRTTESPFTVTYNLNTGLNAAGYDLTEIGTSTHWGDNRAGQRFEVFVDYASSEGTEWVSLGSFYSASPGGQGQAHFMRLGNPADDGSPFATGVAAIRFDVSTSENWDAWYEIDVHGTATPAEAAPYDVWAAGYSLAGGPDDDDDGDGLGNFHEFAFGLDPTSAASASPIVDTGGLKGGYFKYTRLQASGLTYTIWTSPDLEVWTDVTAGVAEESLPEGNGVETVTVDLGAAPEDERFFVRVKAE